jgi:hypothetical protein
MPWRSPASATASCLAAEAVEVVVTVTGLDETISQAVHAHTSYLAHEVLSGHRFSDVFTQTQWSNATFKVALGSTRQRN